MASQYTTRNQVTYTNVRLIRDPKHFPRSESSKSGDPMPACTFLGIFHGTREGEDITVDAKVIRNAQLAANLRKGDMINMLRGQLEFRKDKNGVIRGALANAEFETTVNLKERSEQTTEAAAEPAEGTGTIEESAFA